MGGCRPDGFQSLDKAFLVPLGVVLGIVGHTGIKLVEVYQPIVRQNGLHPNTGHIVQARCHQHVGHSAPGGERVLYRQ